MSLFYSAFGATNIQFGSFPCSLSIKGMYGLPEVSPALQPGVKGMTDAQEDIQNSDDSECSHISDIRVSLVNNTESGQYVSFTKDIQTAIIVSPGLDA